MVADIMRMELNETLGMRVGGVLWGQYQLGGLDEDRPGGVQDGGGQGEAQ